jgi:hypothetical protein
VSDLFLDLNPERLREWDKQLRAQRQEVLDHLSKGYLGRALTGTERKKRWRMTHSIESSAHERDRADRRRSACGGYPFSLPGDCCTYHNYNPWFSMGEGFGLRLPPGHDLRDEIQERMREQ